MKKLSTLPNDTPNIIEELDKIGSPDASALSDDLSSLEQQNSNLQKKFNDERFIWIIIIILIVDCFVFPKSKNWGSPVCLLIIEVILLYCVGVVLQIESFCKLVFKILDSYRTKKDS